MRLHQLKIDYEAEQDRLLMLVSASDGVEVRLTLTRRFVKLLWPLLVKLAEEASPRIRTQANPEARKALLGIEHAQAVARADFTRAYDAQPRSTPLGETPLLLARIQTGRNREGQPVVALHPAEGSGVTLTFENCPMIFSYDEWPGGHNIAYSPMIWRRIFEEWGNGVGMNFDPSHLVWQMIDQGRFIREFGSRMAHVHAKDAMIDRDGLYERGVMSLGMGWQIPRLCGLGDVDWPGYFSELYRAGYDGPVIIEHEDRLFEGTDEKVKRGFLLARDVLQPFIK